MQVKDKVVLAEFSRRGRCEACGRMGDTQVHHVLARGMGGGGRLDLRLNLVALCLACHASHHQGGVPDRQALVALVAARHGLTVDEWRQILALYRRSRD